MIAFGYVGVDGADEVEIEAFHEMITEFGAAEGYTVKEIYIDRGTSPSDLVRPGFQALAEKLVREEVAHVLVPNLDHLGLPTIRTALEATLSSLGSTIVQCRSSPSRTGLAVRVN